MKSVTVVGGGFSGMTAAYFLAKAGLQVELYEGESRLGGLLRTDGGHEWAANGILSNQLVEELASDLDIKLIPAGPQYRNRYLFYEGVRRWPLSLWESCVTAVIFLTNRLFGRHRPRPLETLRDWGHRVLGEALTEKVLRTAVLGIYAAKIEKLSATLTVGRLFNPKAKIRRGRLKGTVAPSGGMEEWIHQIRKFLLSRGAKIHQMKVESLGDFGAENPVVICTHLKDLKALIDPTWHQAFCEIETPSIFTCTMELKPAAEDLRGFGILFHPKEKFSSLGCLFESDNFPSRFENRVERYIFSSNFREELLSATDADILDMALKDRSRFQSSEVDIRERLVRFQVRRIPQGYPSYTLDLERVLASTPLHRQNIYLHGNYCGSLGLAQILARSQALAQELAIKIFDSSTTQKEN